MNEGMLIREMLFVLLLIVLIVALINRGKQ